MRRQRGFTVIEAMISCIVIVVLAIIGIAYGTSQATKATDDTLRDAKLFGQNATGEVNPNVTCAERDTDGDGYVSCTIFPKDKRLPIAIECARGWTFNSGCRMQKNFTK